MSFAFPHLLWLLLLPLAGLAWEWRARRHIRRTPQHPKILTAEISDQAVTVLPTALQIRRARVHPWLAAGLALGILALARPQWGRVDEPVFDQAREILIGVDLSRSMLAPDVKPSRLDRAKLLIQGLLERMEGERIGLVVFSGTAFLQAPLSADYEILREFLPALRPDFLPEGGTNYDALLTTSLEAFGSGAAADRFLIILSDGEATETEWKRQVEALKKKGIRVIGLGLGTSAGAMIPDETGGFVKDERGAVVMSKLEPATLRELADATQGAYRDASAWLDLATLVKETVETGKQGEFVDKKSIRLMERFQWPLALALWCFAVSLFYEFPTRPRARALAMRGPTPARPAGSGGAVSALALLAGCAVFGSVDLKAGIKLADPTAPGAAAQPSPAPAQPPGDPATLGRVVGRLAAKDSLSAADLSEFAHETLRWGRRLQDAKQPVTEGPVRDALAAVDQLQASGNSLSDWSKLRQELEALLKKDDAPQQQPQQQEKPKEQEQKQDQTSQNQQQPSGDQKNDAQDRPQDSKSEQSKQPQDPGAKPGEPKPAQQSAFGDMKPPTPPTSPPSGETQKVGGAQPKDTQPKQPIDPALAPQIEKLERLRNQDSPARLFELMQAEQNQGKTPKPAKDW